MVVCKPIVRLEIFLIEGEQLEDILKIKMVFYAA